MEDDDVKPTKQCAICNFVNPVGEMVESTWKDQTFLVCALCNLNGARQALFANETNWYLLASISASMNQLRADIQRARQESLTMALKVGCSVDYQDKLGTVTAVHSNGGVVLDVGGTVMIVPRDQLHRLRLLTKGGD